MKSAGKARNNGLYRHIRTSKEIIRNLLNDFLNYTISLQKRKRDIKKGQMGGWAFENYFYVYIIIKFHKFKFYLPICPSACYIFLRMESCKPLLGTLHSFPIRKAGSSPEFTNL